MLIAIRIVLVSLLLLVVVSQPNYFAAGRSYDYQYVWHPVETQSHELGLGSCIQQPSGIIGCAIFPSDAVFADRLTPSQNMLSIPSPTPTNPNFTATPLVVIVQDVPTVPVPKDIAFLKFNMTGVLPYAIVASHARPLNASLWLFAEFVNAFYNASVRVYHVPSNDWRENTLTWNNMPAIDMSHYDVDIIRGANRWYRWNVTSDVTRDIQSDGVSSFALMAGFTSWMNDAWFISRAQGGNMTLLPELDLYFLEPTLTLSTSLPNIAIIVDGLSFQSDSSGVLKVPVPWGVHHIAVPASVPMGQGERGLFVGWSDNFSSGNRDIDIENNLTLRVNFQIQYRLDVYSPYASTNGSGWYSAGEVAYATVQPTRVFSEGVMGFLGVQHVFDRWTQDCAATTPTCSIVIDGPKRVDAVWRDDYSVTMLEIVAMIAAAAVVFSLSKRTRTRRR